MPGGDQTIAATMKPGFTLGSTTPSGIMNTNVFGDADAAQKLARLKAQVSGLTGQDLSQQPDVAAKLKRACKTLKNTMLDAAKVQKASGPR
jgi:hypothetical protein